MSGEKSFIGECFGNYRITAELGSGGFGKVYRGEHTILTERAVAIKMLHAHLATPEERERFLQEARLLERLKHPYILRILDVGIHEGFPYLVVEYAPRGSLRDLIKRFAPNLLPANMALNIFTQVGQALYYAHQQNIIHRDLKPENILFNAQGEALLADFGIATTLSTASIKYVTIIGTPAYMAPEQFQSSVSKESDQYSLGCIGYELFTGKRPFTATNFFAMGFDHLNKLPIAPTQHNPYLPMYVEQAILRAMAKQRHARHADIYAFIRALHPSADTQTLPPMPISPATFPPIRSGSSVSASSLQLTQVPATSSASAFNLPQVDVQQKSNEHTPNHQQDSLDVKESQVMRNSPYYQEPETPIPPIHIPFPSSTSPANSDSANSQYPVISLPPTSAPLQDMLHTSDKGPMTPCLPLMAEVQSPRETTILPPINPLSSASADSGQTAQLLYSTVKPILQQTSLGVPLPSTGNPRPNDMNVIANTAYPVQRRNGGRRWLLIAVASLLVLASLLTVLPMVFSHSFSQTQSNVQNTSTSQPLLAATQETTETIVPSHKPTGSPHNQPAPAATTIPATIPTSAPTLTPTPTPSPTRTPTTETLTIYFINGMNGVPTIHSYKGKVTIHVTGEGEEYTNKWFDAFYQYTDANGNAITPVHTSSYPGWTLWINGGVADNYVNPIPAYTGNHDYTVTINAPGGALTFAIGDTYLKDNSGYLRVTVTQD